MFPLNNNTEYINSDGSRSTLGQKISEGGSSYTLPVATASVLGGVKIGLGLSIDENGVLSKVNTGTDGIYAGTTDPDVDLGANGDYYYKRSNSDNWLISGSYTQLSSQTYYGNEFVAKVPCKITKIGGMLGKTMTGSLRIGDLTEVLETIDDISFTASQWSFVNLETPLELQANDHFIIGFEAAGTQHVPYGQSASSYVGHTDVAEYVGGRYGTPYPGTADTARVSVSFEYETDYYLVTDQYVKQSGLWVKIE